MSFDPNPKATDGGDDDFGYYGKVKEKKMDVDDILNTEVFGVRRASVDLRKVSKTAFHSIPQYPPPN